MQVGDQFLLYGAPIGEQRYVEHMLQEQAEEIVADAGRMAELLGSHRHALWAVLKWSTTSCFDYWSQLCPPSLVRPVARWLDGKLWSVLEQAAGQRIPRLADAQPGDILLPILVNGRSGLTFPEQLVRMAVKEGRW
jgi:hypothetical protein